MYICKKCGYQNTGYTKFCIRCGTVFDNSTPSPNIKEKPNRVVQPVQPQVQQNNTNPTPTNVQVKKTKENTVWKIWTGIFIAICVIFAFCVLGVIVGWFNGGSSNKLTTSTNNSTVLAPATVSTTITGSIIAPVQSVTPAQIPTTATPIPTPVETTSQKDYLRDSVMEITYAKMTGPNSVGGMSFDIDVKNKSDKEIKYVRFEIGVVNRVGDLLNSDTDSDSEPLFWLQMVGPIAKGEKGGLGKTWDCPFYNTTSSGWGIYSIQIEYTDGNTLELDSNEVSMVNLA